LASNVLLLNDTSDQDHPGCRLVVKNTHGLCRRHGLHITSSVPHDTVITRDLLDGRLDAVDIVMLNGEGTMHDDARKAEELLDAVARTKRLGKKAVLYNTLWQNNRRLNQYLDCFDLIFARESYSARQIQEAGFDCSVVPDMVFATSADNIPARRQVSDPVTLVLDSVKKDICVDLARFAAKNRYQFMPMHKKNYILIKKHFILNWTVRHRKLLGTCQSDIDFINKIAECDRLISGRFHGLCLGILLKKQVVAVSSNTHKIEGLFYDAGIPEHQIVKYEKPRFFERMANAIHMDIDSSGAAERYNAHAQREIDAMFHRISRLTCSA
jgi:exopolysaccharide biosynthesis predicted pyruvyltransferase EpsI